MCGARLGQQRAERVGARAHAVLHVFLRRVGHAAVDEFLRHHLGRHLLQRAEIGKLLRRARAEKRCSLPLPAWAMRRRRSVKPRKGAEPVPVQIMTTSASGSSGSRKVVPKGPMTPRLSPTFRSQSQLDATPRKIVPSGAGFGDALDGQRQVVRAGLLAVARAGRRNRAASHAGGRSRRGRAARRRCSGLRAPGRASRRNRG